MLQLLLLLISLCSGILLPRPSGPYQLTLNVSELIDYSRKDPWEMGPIKYRRIMISRFDPLPPNTCYRNEKVSYMSPTISSAEDAIFAPYGLPPGVFASLEMVLCFQPSFATRMKPGLSSSSLQVSTPLVSCTPC
jgi:hypothetical protein